MYIMVRLAEKIKSCTAVILLFRESDQKFNPVAGTLNDYFRDFLKKKKNDRQITKKCR